MKHFIIIIIGLAFSIGVKSQVRGNVKRERPKIKSANVIIVPDQKPVIIERSLDPVVQSGKKKPAAYKSRVSKKTGRTTKARPPKLTVQKARKSMKISKKPAVPR